MQFTVSCNSMKIQQTVDTRPFFFLPRAKRASLCAKKEGLGTRLTVAMHALSVHSWRKTSVAFISHKTSSSPALRLSSLMSGTERTARALNKVTTDGLDLMGVALL